MGKAAKTILDALRAAKVPAAWQARASKLVDEAPDWDDQAPAEIGAIVRYVCGAGPLPAKLTKDCLEHHAGDLIRGLSAGRALDGWDERALDVIARGRGLYWFWNLDSWLRRRVAKFPAEPIFEEALALLRPRGVWKTDDEVVASMVNHLTAHVTDDGALTSTGRWLLARLDADPDGVLAIARAQKRDETSSLYPLVLGHRRPLFDKLLPRLKLEADGDRSYLAQCLLDADPRHFEAQAVALVTGLTAPGPAVYSAKNLHRHFPGQHVALVKALLLAAVTANGEMIVLDDDATDTRSAAVELAWPILGAGALEIWRAYREENEALRLEAFATMAKRGRAATLPLLVDGLVQPKDPDAEYGGVTHAKYVARMLEILKPFDLAPHRERIVAAFAANKDRKIRELIDGRFAAKGAKGAKGAKAAKAAVAAKGAKPAKAAPPPDGSKGYRFDSYAASVVTAALAAVKKHAKRLPSPIQSVKLIGHQGQIRLDALEIEGVGEPVTLALKVPATRVPFHVDDVDDGLLEKFAARHQLDDGEGPAWGDMFELPWCALLHEQIAAAEAVVAGMRAMKLDVAKKCKAGAGEDDNFWESTASFAKMAREQLAALPRPQQADFAAVCFETPAKQRWLMKK